MQVQIPLPRKGTETFSLLPQYFLHALSMMFKFHYPERGRKLNFSVHVSLKCYSSNSITPKGDGNFLVLC